jgi:crotonobetainyl-CoA:carnitine CoA-transferase CaiB-like acyl-CoA transferase
MLGMTNSQHYWPAFCEATGLLDIRDDPQYATQESRSSNAAKLVTIIKHVFLTKSYEQWVDILSRNKLIWSPVKTPIEVTHDEQAIANDFFGEWDHPTYGTIKMLNNPIKLSKTRSANRLKAPDLGEHTAEILKELGYSSEQIAQMKQDGDV